MRLVRNIIILTLAVLCSMSCKMISQIIHDGDVLARVGKEKLYKETVEPLVPRGLSVEDSLAFINRYAQAWVEDEVYAQQAQARLGKDVKDIQEQVARYRRSLLKYRYEQEYVAEKLDSLVQDDEIAAYYDAHKQDLKISYPIVKAIYVRMLPDSPNADAVEKELFPKKNASSDKLDSLVFASAERYTDFGGEWVEIMALAREFSLDYGTLIASMKDSKIDITDADGKRHLAKVTGYMKAGSVPPVEYCKEKIRDVIVSARKKALLNCLEQELLEDAREQGLFEIYQEQ